MSSKAKPVHEVRLGRIRAAIWANSSGDNGTRYNVTFSRLYRDEEGSWRDSSSFGRDDLPLIEKVADLAHFWIFEAARAEREQSAEGDAPAEK